jgi:hypothetical protein
MQAIAWGEFWGLGVVFTVHNILRGKVVLKYVRPVWVNRNSSAPPQRICYVKNELVTVLKLVASEKGRAGNI